MVTPAPSTTSKRTTYDPCKHWKDPDGYCGAKPTRMYGSGRRCRDHTPAALAGRPETVPDPALTLIGLREAAGAAGPMPPAPASATRLVDDRAVASGKRRSTPNASARARTT